MGLKKFLQKFGCVAPTPQDHDWSHHGRHVTRHFRVLKKLGVGSWGSVYLVERLTDGRQYALKETVITDLEQPLRRMAVNEIRILASLDPHPHVVNCLEGFLDGNNLCIVMELMPNGELADIIQRHAEKDTLIPEADIWAYFIQIALGLKFMHCHGILHRDLKPANILINAEGRLKIADLGVSHVVTAESGTTKVQIGTPQYMAPEVWRRDPYSFPADVWALGCILHEMCTRRPLFLAATEQEVESRVIAGVVPPISKRYSQDLRDLIAAMLEYSAEDRPTVEDVLSSEAVQSRMERLAEESHASMKGLRMGCERAASKILDPIEIPADLTLLNLHLPPSRYSIGDGLVTVLRAESLPQELPSVADLGTRSSGALETPRKGGELRTKGSGAMDPQPSSELGTMASGAISIADTAYDGAATPAASAQKSDFYSPFASVAGKQRALGSAGALDAML